MKNRLETMFGYGKNLAIASLAAGMFLFSGCEDTNNDETTTLTATSPVTSPKKDDNRNDSSSPSVDITAAFAITYPISGGSAPYRTVMRGVGIKKKVAGYSSRVVTNQSYDQVGSLSVKGDGSWKYDPLYIGGTAKSIEMNVTYIDGTRESATINNISPQ